MSATQLDSAERALVNVIRHAFPLTPDAPAAPVAVTDWSQFVRAAETHALASLAYAALNQAEQPSDAPAGVIDQLRIAYLRSNVANWLAFQELDCLLEMFGREQIPVVVLKGGALAHALYGDVALRPMMDLDLLAPPSQQARVSDLMAQQGYTSPTELAKGFGERFSNYQAFERGGNRPSHIEIHWHLFKSPYYCERIPIDWFWDRTMEISIGSARARVFDPDAQLVHLCAHFALHHQAERLLWSYDLARLLTRYGSEVNWSQVVDAAKRFGLSQAIELSLARVVETWQISLPADVFQRLDAARPTLDQRIAFAMLTAPRGEARVILDTLSARDLSGRLIFGLRHIFPSAEYMRERYRIREMRLLPFYYARRLADGARKLGQSLISMIANH